MGALSRCVATALPRLPLLVRHSVSLILPSRPCAVPCLPLFCIVLTTEPAPGRKTRSRQLEAVLTLKSWRRCERHAGLGILEYASGKTKPGRTFIDTYTRVADVKFYDRKNALVAADIPYDRILPFYESHEVKLLRVLTDRGTE